jgi:hypothetical protein
MKTNIILIVFGYSLAMSGLTRGESAANLQAATPDAGFTAYHTRMNPSPVGHIGKYEDLVVTLGKTTGWNSLVPMAISRSGGPQEACTKSRNSLPTRRKIRNAITVM